MTIPKEKLVLKLNPDDMSLDEVDVFDISLAETNPFGYLVKIRDFLKKYSASWTPQQIGAIKVSEIEQVVPFITEAVAAVSVPLETSSS